MNKALVTVFCMVSGLVMLPACVKKQKTERVEQHDNQQESKEQRTVEAGKELVEWCENTKWCGCPKE